jgi:uncharacterized membrane protein
MSYRRFIRWTLAACAVWATAYVSVGALAHSAYDQFAGQLKWAGLIFVAVIAIFATLVHFAKQRLETKAAAMIAESEAAKPKLDSLEESEPELPVTPPRASEL